jgi:hypothetical protein
MADDLWCCGKMTANGDARSGILINKPLLS